MRSLIAFTGPMGCGKTTAANAVIKSQSYCKLISFGAPLKEAVMGIFQLTHDQVYTMEGKMTADPRWGMAPRDILQKFGTDAMRRTFPGVWVQRARQEISSTGIHVVIDDVRFEDEAALVRELGGTVVHIGGRSLSATAEQHGHASEFGVEIADADIVINNAGTKEEFEAVVTYLLKPTAN